MTILASQAYNDTALFVPPCKKDKPFFDTLHLMEPPADKKAASTADISQSVRSE